LLKRGGALVPSYLKQVHAPAKTTVYEIKSHQERALFFRRTNDAIAVCGFVKKDDWSKKDAATLAAAAKWIDAAAREFGGRP